MTRFKRVSSVTAIAASLAMAASPVAAANVGSGPSRAAAPSYAAWQSPGQASNYDRRYRGGHHDRIDAGDVLAGVLILGGIAAIASAASKPRTERRYPVEQPPYRDNNRRSTSGGGIDRAVDMCLGEIERDVRVESVDSVDRTGEGWRVTGRIYNGDTFDCQIGNDGNIEGVSFGGRTARIEDRQWDDARYAEARRQADSSATPTYSDEQMPAYPGGPIDGDIDNEYGG